MLTNEILSAICRTFLHSVWQGLLAAIIAGAVLALTRRSSARKRYNLLGAILLVCILGTGVTLFLELQAAGGAGPAEAAAAVAAEGLPLAAPAPVITTSYWDVLMNYLNTHAPFIMLVWSIVFLFKCFRMGFGFYHIYYIRHHKTSEPDQNWSERLLQLARPLGIQRNVRLVESALVKVPLTTGFIRPCIFLPLGLLAQLPADQVEAILLHELAHIRRNDYLVNIVQSFAESIFFFNPAMLWISARLREEREACCDDVTLAHTPQKASYLNALVAFASHSHNERLEMAITHQQNFLLNRVKRMLTRENQKLSLAERAILIVGLLVISAFTLIPAPMETAQPAPDQTPFVVYRPATVPSSPVKTAIRKTDGDTVVPGKTTYNTRFSFTMDSANVTTFNMDSSFSKLNYNFQYTPSVNVNQQNMNVLLNNDVTLNKSNVNLTTVQLKDQHNVDIQFKTVLQENTQLSIDTVVLTTPRMQVNIDSSFKTHYNFNYQFQYTADSTFRYPQQDSSVPRKPGFKSKYPQKPDAPKTGPAKKKDSRPGEKTAAEWQAMKDSWKTDSTKNWKKGNAEWQAAKDKWNADATAKWKKGSAEWQAVANKWSADSTKKWKKGSAAWQAAKDKWEADTAARWKNNWKAENVPAKWQAAKENWKSDSSLKRKKAVPEQPSARPKPAKKTSAAQPGTSDAAVQQLPQSLHKLFILPERIDC